MENIREIISKNLVELRKKNKLTQVELGKKINYSDKAISRWEKGEVLPDIEVLEVIANVYNLPIAYFFSEHIPDEEKVVLRGKQLAVDFMSISAIWTLFIVGFVYLQINFNLVFWQAFIWPVPMSILSLIVSWRKKSQPVWLKILLSSLLNWATITCVYLQLIEYNAWLLFIVGVPIQATIIATILTKGVNNKKGKKAG